MGYSFRLAARVIFYVYIFKKNILKKKMAVSKEGSILFNDASTHFIYGYMASDIW